MLRNTRGYKSICSGSGKTYRLSKKKVSSFFFQRYYKPLKTQQDKANQVVSNVLIDDIFFQIPQILAHHESFLADLKMRLDSWDHKKTVGDWFLNSVSYKELWASFLFEVPALSSFFSPTSCCKVLPEQYWLGRIRVESGSITEALAPPLFLPAFFGFTPGGEGFPPGGKG